MHIHGFIWYVRNYVRMMCQDGDHAKKVIEWKRYFTLEAGT